VLTSTSTRSSHKSHKQDNPVEIHLQYLPDVVPLARSWNHTGPFWPRRAATLVLPVRLQDFSTSPAHHWKKAKVKVSKLYNKIANIRKDFVHKSSNDVSKNHAVVFVEDLSIRNLSKAERGSQENHGRNVKQKSCSNRAVLDASPFELCRQLQYRLT
jgi:Probable transposase